MYIYIYNPTHITLPIFSKIALLLLIPSACGVTLKDVGKYFSNSSSSSKFYFQQNAKMDQYQKQITANHTTKCKPFAYFLECRCTSCQKTEILISPSHCPRVNTQSVKQLHVLCLIVTAWASYNFIPPAI